MGTSMINTLRGINVLLVEDDEDSQDTMRLMLEMEGAAVACAKSAAEGLRAVFARRPDVLVCDLGLPGADGYAFIRQIRELPMELGGATRALAAAGAGPSTRNAPSPPASRNPSASGALRSTAVAWTVGPPTR